MFKERLAVIIPTKERPNELQRLLQSLLKQEARPIQVIVVDSGNKDLSGILKSFNCLPIDYIRQKPPSLTRQRNAGIGALKEEATLVSFFDDDSILKRNCLENLMRFWDMAPEDVGGACLNNVSLPSKKPNFFEKIFIVNANSPGRILPSGFLSPPCGIDETTQVDWVTGYAMVFRKKIFKEFMFDERFSGYALYEDVDFSYRVRKKYKLFILKDAQVEHESRMQSLGNSFVLGKNEVMHRLYFVKKYPDLSLGLCCWGLLGLFLNNITKGVSNNDKRYKIRAKGNIYGFMEFFLKGRD